MYHIAPMQDMAMPVKNEQTDVAPVAESNEPRYPWGLCLTLTNDELEKLGVEDMPEVGDMIHLFAFAKVTAVSMNETQDGQHKRIELQITHLAVEDEDEENEEEDAQEKLPYGGLYKK